VSSRNGAVAPSEFPPPVDPVGEFVKRELDSEDERIEVGVAIVGGGTAGLATANRLLQLLGDDPETMERLGEVPVAVIEKAKTCGGHNLSGAVMRPGPLQELFPDMTREQWREQGFAFGEVDKEAVYMTPTSKRAIRIPTPPPFKNHGNEVVSVAALARYQQQRETASRDVSALNHRLAELPDEPREIEARLFDVMNAEATADRLLAA